MTRLQQELSDAIVHRDAKKQRLESLRQKFAEKNAEASTLAEQCATARTEYSDRAGRFALDSTSSNKKALEQARNRHDELILGAARYGVEVEGVEKVVAKAETEFDDAERNVSIIGSQIAASMATALEPRGIRLATELGRILLHHRRLARLASSLATEANGSLVEPVRGMNGESTPWRREIEAALTGDVEQQSPTLIDLLEWPLVEPEEAVAAE